MKKRCIILGSGASVRWNLWEIPIKELPIFNAIKNECTIGLNYSYNWFNSTVQMFTDYYFYCNNKKGLNLSPLVIGKDDPHLNGLKNDDKSCKIEENVKLIPHSSEKYYGLNSWKYGFFKSQLVGILALTFAVACGFEEIFLLGYDGCNINDKTHFYQEKQNKIGYYKIDSKNVTGIGFRDKLFNGKKQYNTGIFNQLELLNQFFDEFKVELNRIKIVNVSLASKITAFPKMSHTIFYKILEDNPQKINQNKIRNEIRQMIKEKIK